MNSNTIHLRRSPVEGEVIENDLEGWTATINEEMLAGVTWAADSR